MSARMRNAKLRRTGPEQGSSSVVHGQRVHQLAGGGAQRPPLEQGEAERRVVRGDVQLEGGVDADQQVDGLDGELLQPHGPHQRQRGLEHLLGQERRRATLPAPPPDLRAG